VAQSTVKLIVDAQNAISPLRQVNKQTQALSRSTDKLKGRLDRSNASLRGTGRAAKAASTGVGTLVGALRPLLAAIAVLGTARFIFVKTAELETQRKSLEVLTGSIEKTNKIIKELQDFGAVTPFTSSELIEQTKRLKAFGFETSELVDTTKRLSEVAGATGADLQGIATAFGQIRAKGKLQQEENLQLLERGVDITTELKRITGLQGEAFEKAQRQGKIGADLVNQALINLTNEGGAFFGGATAQATTLNGKLSTLIDSVETLARTIGNELEDELKGILQLAIDGVKEINKLVERIGTANKVGRINLANIAMEARGEARGQVRKEQGFFAPLTPEGRKREQELFEEIKAAKIKAALEERSLKIKKDTDNKQKDINKKVQEAKDKAEAIKNNNNETLEISNLFNENLESTISLLDGVKLGSSAFSSELENATSEADKLKEKFMEIGQSIENGVVQNLTDAAMGTQTLGQAAINVLNNLKRKLIEVAMQQAVSGLGNFLGKALGNIFGGGSSKASDFITAPFTGGGGSKFLDMAPKLKFANGGRPPVGKTSLVGERGPELFVPKVAGTIIPNNKLGGGDNTTNIVNVSVDASGSAVSGNDAQAEQLGAAIAQAVQQQLVKEKRSGGLLAR